MGLFVQLSTLHTSRQFVLPFESTCMACLVFAVDAILEVKLNPMPAFTPLV